MKVAAVLQDPAVLYRQIDPEQLPALTQAEEASFRDQTDFEMELRFCRADGQWRWFQVRSRPRKSADGQTIWDGVVTDITARKQTEAVAAQLAAIVESSNDAIIGKDLNGIIQTWNSGAERIFGYAASEVIGEFIRKLIPVDRQHEEAEILQKVLRGERVEHYETVRQTKAGTLIDVSVTVSPLKDNTGRIIGFSKVARDVTERKRAHAALQAALENHRKAEVALRENEERLRLALSAANQGFYDVDIPTGRTIVSPEYARMLGYEPEEFHESNAAWRERLHPDERAQVWRFFEEYLAGQQATYRIEFRQRTKCGDWKWILSVGRLVARDAEGKPLRMLGTHTDITERKQAETALQESERRLKETQRMAQLGHWRWDVKSGRVEWSEEVFNIFRLDPNKFTPRIDSILALSPWPEDRERDKELIRKALESHQKGTYDQRFLRPDGSVGHYHSTFQGEYDAAGNLEAIIGTVLDITERKRAETALRENEARYRELFAGMSSGVAVFEAIRNGEDFAIKDFNPAAERIARTRREEAVGRLVSQVFPQAKPAGLFAVLQRVWQHGQPETHPTRFYQDERLTFWADDYVYRLPTGEVVVMFDDITERKRVEDALQREQGLLRALVDHLPVAVYAKDPAGRKTLVNAGDARNLGLASPAEALGKTDFDLLPREQAERFHADDQQVLQTGQPVLNREESLTRPDGSTVWLLTSKVPLRDTAGQVTGLVGMGLDITQRRQAEERLRKLAHAVEQSPASIVITDRAGNIEFVNRKFTEISGYTAAEVLGQSPRILKSGETSAEEYGLLWKTITAGNEWHGEFHNKRKDGTLYWESAFISAIRDASGNITHFVAVKEDLTERKLTQAKLLRAQRVESIGSLASGIAHDLNNILTPIIMCAPLLQSEESPENRQEMVHAIESSAHRAVGIVKQLLSFARGKEGQKTTVEARHLIRDMAKIARETFPRSIHVEELCARDLWPVVADVTQLHQVLLNLCVNARDAMPSGGTLTLRADNVILDDHYVSMHKEALPGPFIRIQVADTGTGIPDDVRDRIFDSFFTTKDEDEGTGLGLTTVQGLVKDHKGFMTFTSVVGKGTTFVIHLPAVPAAPVKVEAVQARAAIPRGQGELILVVDDELPICDATQRTLQRHGYRVLQAHNGIEALTQFTPHQQEIRAVVTDFMMPLMDGVTLCRALRALSPATPLIVSSGGLFGKSGGKALQAFEELGLRHILYKPHTADLLLQTLAQALHPSATAATGEATP